jgi:hypothetical protein
VHSLEGEARADPFADTLFGVVTIVIFAIALLLPTMDSQRRAARRHDHELAHLLVDRQLLVEGGRPLIILATADGAELAGAAPPHQVPLAAILDDAPLARALTAARDSNARVLLAIAPDAEEAAFLLEGVIFRHGPAQLLQLRLDRHCGFLRGALQKRLCPTSRAERPAGQP